MANNEKEETYHDLVIKPCITAGIGGVLSLSVVGTDVKMYGGLPAPLILGVSIGGASLVSGVLKETVYENALGDDSAELLYSMTTPVLTGLTGTAVLYGMLGGKIQTDSMLQMFFLAGASEVAATWIDDKMLGDVIDLE
jgi:hypothetical protein